MFCLLLLLASSYQSSKYLNSSLKKNVSYIMTFLILCPCHQLQHCCKQLVYLLLTDKKGPRVSLSNISKFYLKDSTLPIITLLVLINSFKTLMYTLCWVLNTDCGNKKWLRKKFQMHCSQKSKGYKHKYTFLFHCKMVP